VKTEAHPAVRPPSASLRCQDDDLNRNQRKMPNDTLTITDNRTGKTYEVPITDGTIRTMDLRQIKANEADFGLMGYDPAFMNTASCRSAVTFIDGDEGILRYRGYPVQELAERATWMETAYLILNGELPNAAQLEEWESDIKRHTFIHENVRQFLQGFRYDAHPMGMLVSTIGALSTYYPEAKDVLEKNNRRRQITRLIAKIPTVAAWAYRFSRGLPFIYPDPNLSYSANFLRMLKMNQEPHYVPHPDVVKALDVLFILHADHEQNCSANVMRSIGSSQADPYSAIAGSIAALYGPLHGGANEAVLRMLQQIGTKDKVPEFVAAVKDGSAGQRLMGFGHRVYKNYDPRAKVIKKLAENVFRVIGRANPLLDVALELEKIALEDPYFVQRKLYPNVDFYSGLIYEALEIPVEMYTVMFAIPRTVGWLAQWEEMITDKEQKIARPRQIYTGYGERAYKPLVTR
jgi:citrate synthase